MYLPNRWEESDNSISIERKVFMKKWKTVVASMLILISAVGIGYRLLQADGIDTVFAKEKGNDVFTVVIDPGHGGYDVGTIALDNQYEKDITLDVAKRLGSLLEEEGINVIYTRDSDDVSFAEENNNKDLEYRSDVANRANADLFISIHCNSSENGDGYGFETWTNPSNSVSKKFSKNIQKSLSELKYTQDRGVHNGKNSLHIINQSNVPTALVELGFIDYDQDYAFITRDSGKELIARALAEAIIETKNSI